MPTTQQTLETLIAKVRTLPEERQQAVVAALREIADVPYVLSDEELATLTPALEEARRGVGLTDAADDDLLNQPWR